MSWMLSMKTAASQLAAVTNCDVGSEEALASPDVEDLLASGRTKQVQDGRDRQPSMIRAAPVADPAVIPGGDTIPARLVDAAARKHVLRGTY
jgi:hypothetical protein